MCGIAGHFAYHHAALDICPEKLATLCERQTHRGPDAQGVWLDPDNRIGLTHNRLSIIDLSDQAHQPLSNPDQSLVISFNGEIYNYVALREELEAKGYSFKSQSDTEVLVHLYDLHGPEMLKHLRGMFAFALWDQKKQGLFLARDPYGIKPLYYADDGWNFLFASESKTLLANKYVNETPSEEGWLSFFLTGSVAQPHTIYQGIYQLEAGSWMWVDACGPHPPKPYFSFNQVLTNPTEKSFEAIYETMKASVKAHFVADVSVGLFLSSGIDSCLLLKMAKELGFSPQAITLGFEEFKGTEKDEVPLAQQFAKEMGVKHHVHWLSKEEFESERETYFQSMDQPTIDGLNTYLISKVAKEKGLKAVLSGVGGDELFGSYPSFRNIPIAVSFFKWIGWLPFLGQLFQLLVRMLLNLKVPIHPKWTQLFYWAPTTEGAYRLQRDLWMPWEMRGENKPSLSKQTLKRYPYCKKLRSALRPKPKTLKGEIMLLESLFYLRQQLLKDADWASMAHGIEMRTPFVDAQLWQETAGSFSLKKGNLKREFAKAAGLPEAIVHRPKTGFFLPLASWLQTGPRWARDWAVHIYKRFGACEF